MTFLGGTAAYYGGPAVANPCNILTSIVGQPPSHFKAPLGTISLDFGASEAWMLVSNEGGVGVWLSITGAGTGSVDTLKGNTGGAVPPSGGNINVVGVGDISVDGNIGTSTLTISSTSSAAFIWQTTAGASVPLVPNNGYNPLFAGTTTFTLPVSCPYGQIIEIGGTGIGLWILAQNASQSIFVANTITTSGVSGSVTSTSFTDCIRLLCIVEDLQFLTLSCVGNLTII